jgi:hypothetical protein
MGGGRAPALAGIGVCAAERLQLSGAPFSKGPRYFLISQNLTTLDFGVCSEN